MKSILTQLEDKVFAGPVKIYQVFKQFDKDGDGYVSYADFEDHLSALQIPASKHEVEGILKLLDKENKGYLDFRAFSAVVSPSMSAQINVKRQQELHLPNLVPSKARARELGEKAAEFQQSMAEIRKSLQPALDKQLLDSAPTRFSSKPTHSNTFQNFYNVVNSMAPASVQHSERYGGLGKHLNNSVQFQKVEKDRKQRVVEAKAEVMRYNQENLEMRKIEHHERRETKD